MTAAAGFTRITRIFSAAIMNGTVKCEGPTYTQMYARRHTHRGKKAQTDGVIEWDGWRRDRHMLTERDGEGHILNYLESHLGTHSQPASWKLTSTNMTYPCPRENSHWWAGIRRNSPVPNMYTHTVYLQHCDTHTREQGLLGKNRLMDMNEKLQMTVQIAVTQLTNQTCRVYAHSNN